MPVRLTPPRVSSPATEGSRPPPRRSLCAGVRTSKALFLLGARSRGDGQAWGSPLVAPVPAIRGFPTQVLGRRWNIWPAHGPPYTVTSERFKETRNVSPLQMHATEVGLHHPAFCHAATLILSQREILVPLANALGDR